MDAACCDAGWMLFGTARGESLMVRRFLSLVVNREPLLSILWNGVGLDVAARGLLSRVMVIASQSHRALAIF